MDNIVLLPSLMEERLKTKSFIFLKTISDNNKITKLKKMK